MTPDDFPNHSSYMTYVTMCEKAWHTAQCLEDSVYDLRVRPYSYGLQIQAAKGALIATNYSQPIIKIKVDHGDGTCYTCNEEYQEEYWESRYHSRREFYEMFQTPYDADLAAQRSHP